MIETVVQQTKSYLILKTVFGFPKDQLIVLPNCLSNEEWRLATVFGKYH